MLCAYVSTELPLCIALLLVGRKELSFATYHFEEKKVRIFFTLISGACRGGGDQLLGGGMIDAAA